MANNIEMADILRGYFAPGYKGTLLEIGAAHPTMISISLPLRNNWNIISVEPNPIFCAEFRKMNFSILEYAACDEDKGITSFQISPNGVSCSALKVKDGNYEDYNRVQGWSESDYTTVEVQALKLDTILQKHHPELQIIDVLLIDVEGWELEVLRGFDLEKYNPKVICLENLNDSPEYATYMMEKGYRLDRKEVQDEFYVR